MPGNLLDQEWSMLPGYYDKRYPDNAGFNYMPEPSKEQKQVNRIMTRIRKKFLKKEDIDGKSKKDDR